MPKVSQAVIEDGDLVIAGTRVLPAELRTAIIHRLELPQGRFYRRLRLPAGRYGAVRRAVADGCLVITFAESGSESWLKLKCYRKEAARRQAAARAAAVAARRADHRAGAQHRAVSRHGAADHARPAEVGRRRPAGGARAAPGRHPAAARPPRSTIRPAIDMHRMGTVANIVRYITAPDGTHHLVCQGEQRFQIVEFLDRLAVPGRARAAHSRARDAHVRRSRRASSI